MFPNVDSREASTPPALTVIYENYIVECNHKCQCYFDQKCRC